MEDAIRVEAPNEESAQTLAHALAGRFPLEVARREGRWLVIVTPDRSIDRLVVELLDEVDRWLLVADVSKTQVHLDGRTYTMSRP
jgi:hypothetical protein